MFLLLCLFFFFAFHAFSFFPLPVRMITLLHPYAATSGVLCSILGSTAQERQRATGEGPGGQEGDEGSAASLQAGDVGWWAHSCPCSQAVSTTQAPSTE